MSKIGYARVSSKSQKLDRQIESLESSGCEKIFTDIISGVEKKDGLIDLMNYIREGDIVVVTELDRLGRNNKDITNTMEAIQKKGATFSILNLPSFNTIENENLRKLLNQIVLEIYLYQAESERERIKERQQQGIEIAKAQGKYKGRKRLFKDDDPRLLHAIELKKHGLSLKEVSQKTGINATTLHRYLNKYELF